MKASLPVWSRLHAYLMILPIRLGPICTERSISPKSAHVEGHALGVPPSTAEGEAKEPIIPDALPGNSGHIDSCKLRPTLPRKGDSRIGTMRSSTAPDGTVERTTTVCRIVRVDR